MKYYVLIVFENDIFYSTDANVNNYIVLLKLISDKPNQLIFANIEHDFPNRISLANRSQIIYMM